MQPSNDNYLRAMMLTHRETEVLRCVVLGFSSKEAARKLDKSPRTIDRYVEIVRFKLRAKNRTHMVARAVQAGLLELSEDQGFGS
ncbi:MAG: helix-turn-helix transcriptional regulator [Pseudomonadota bacterium]